MDPPKKTTKRSFLGRSRQGCLLCRARHIKCDGAMPCRNCERGGRTCPGNVVLGDRTVLRHSLSVAGRRGDHIETRTFFHFVMSLSPQLGGYYDPTFWQTALPMTHDHDQVYNALMAVATLYFLPMSDITNVNTLQKAVPAIIRNRYQHAQQWYSRSVNQSIATVARQSDTLNSTRLLLVTTIFYIYAELRQAHYASLEQLFHTAFAIVHSARSTLLKSKDVGILASLARLCDFAFTTGLNGSAVPRAYWQSAILVGLSISANLGVSELYQIQFEFNNIQYDVDCITSYGQRDMIDADLDDYGLTHRFQQWDETTARFEKQPELPPMIRIHLARLRCLFPIYKARWTNFQMISATTDWTLFEKPIDQFVSYFELMLRLSTTKPFSGPAPLYLLEMVWIPSCIYAVWHRRAFSTAARCTAMLEKFRTWGQDKFLDTVISYLQILRMTEHEQSTEVERELFGGRPHGSLLLWQSHTITRHLLLISGQTTNNITVIDKRIGWPTD